MITFQYLTPWEVYWTVDNPRESKWLKNQFTKVDYSDLYHKKQFGYFPQIEYLDTIGARMTHGQVLQAIDLCQKDGIEYQITNQFPRLNAECGTIPGDFLPGIAMRDYQCLATQIAAGQGQGLICIDTGGGKTVVMGALLRIILENTQCTGVLILINNKNLLNQTARRMNQYGVPMDDIGIVHSDISPQKQAEESQKRVVLSTHMSITKYQGTIERTQYLLCDEAHHCVGPLWSALISRLPNMLNAIGFTATPWENDDEEMRMRSIFGRVLVDIPARYLIKRGFLMRPEIYMIKLEYPDRDREICAKMSWQEAKKLFVEEDKARNLLPVACLKKVPGRMLVLYDTIKHGKEIARLYDHYAEQHGFSSMIADGSTSTKKRDAAIEWFEQDCDVENGESGKVLIGSRIFDEGTDIQGGCDTLFVLGAAKSKRKAKQRCGRALRKNRSGKLYIFDVWDSNHTSLRDWSGKRKKVWEELGVPINVITLKQFMDLEL